MITLQDYFGKSNVNDKLIINNATDLISRFDRLEANIRSVQGYENFEFHLRCGYRDPLKNAKVGGANNSTHMTGEGVDMEDNDEKIDTLFVAKPELLIDLGLWQEHPYWTKTWFHGDKRQRVIKKHGMNVFVPSLVEPIERLKSQIFFGLPRV